MAEPKRLQSRRPAAVAAYLIAFLVPAAAIAYSARPLLEPVGADVTNAEITRSAKLPIFMWCLGWPIALAKHSDKFGMRFAWTLGCALLLVHIAVAFHLGHAWSHQAVWEHTRQVGGYGDGVFVNYAFALVWLADVLWAWVAFDSYIARPRWLNGTAHGFLAFVVVNAAFVFGSWKMRILFASWFLTPFVGFFLLRRLLRRLTANQSVELPDHDHVTPPETGGTTGSGTK